MSPLNDLLHQARWLHFKDAAAENQFHEERQRDGLTRVRVMLVLAITFVTAVGFRLAMISPAGESWQFADQLHYRFFVVAPAWLLVLVSTLLPGHTRRAEWIYAGTTLIVLWGLVVMDWLWLIQAGRRATAPVSLMTIDFVEVLVLSTFTLPVRVWWQAVMSVGGAAGALGFLAVAMPATYAREN